MAKHKRKLTKREVELMRQIMDGAPQGRKPSVRYFANLFHVNQPTIIKAMGGWAGVHRNRPEPPPKPILPTPIEHGASMIEPAQFGAEGTEAIK